MDEQKKTEMPYLTIEKKANIFATHGGKASNTGSIEGQVALLTERINHISNHLKGNKKDFSSQRGLMMMVGQRKRLLTYLSKQTYFLLCNKKSFPTVLMQLGIILFAYIFYMVQHA